VKVWTPLLAVIVFTLAVVATSMGFNTLVDGPNAVVAMPTEVVVEDFMRALAQGRWDVARDFLTDDLNAQTSDDDLRALAEDIENRIGHIDEVSADSGERQGHRATATAQLTGSDGQHSADFELIVQQGGWKIAQLPSE
jgi:hypothetical protein